MTRKRVKVVLKPPMKSETAAMSAIVHEGLKDHPEVQLVLEIAQRARELDAAVVPVSMEPSGDWRATSAISSPIPMS